MPCCFAAGRAALRGWSTRRRATDARPGGLPAQVCEARGGVGCDVVLDAGSGKIDQQAIESAADGHGRVGIYGVASGTWTALDAAQIVQRGLTIIGALGAIFSKSPTEQRADAEHALALAAADQLRPRIPRDLPRFNAPPTPTPSYSNAARSAPSCSPPARTDPDDQRERPLVGRRGLPAIWKLKTCRERVAAPDPGADLLPRRGASHCPRRRRT